MLQEVAQWRRRAGLPKRGPNRSFQTLLYFNTEYHGAVVIDNVLSMTQFPGISCAEYPPNVGNRTESVALISRYRLAKPGFYFDDSKGNI